MMFSTLPLTSCSSATQTHKRKWFRKSWASKTWKSACFHLAASHPGGEAQSTATVTPTVRVEWGRPMSPLEPRVITWARYKLFFFFFLEVFFFSLTTHHVLISTEKTSFSFLPPKRRSQCWAQVPGWGYTSQLASVQASQLSISILEEQLWQSPWPCLEIFFPLLFQTKLIWSSWVNLTFSLWGACVHLRGWGGTELF